MSLIACTDPCVYQKDGYCSLSRSVSGGYPSETRSCVHFLPESVAELQNGGKGFTDIGNLNKS